MDDGSPAEEGWEDELARWLAPFLERLRRKAQRRGAPFCLKGLILPGERKSVEPMAARVAPADTQQLHHFVSTSPWPTAPLEAELARTADRPVGGPDAVLVVDDTALVKQGRRSVGVKRRYCGQLGKKASCQALVSLTLARGEVPVRVGLRLACSCPRTGAVTRSVGPRRACPRRSSVARSGGGSRSTGSTARWLASGARIGCVLADAECGEAAAFRHGLSERGLPWAAGILPTRKVHPADVTLAFPERKPTGRPRKHPVPSAASVAAAELIEARPAAFRAVAWRTGTKGRLQAQFAALRVRVADDGPVAARAQHLPGEEAWLVGEHRADGERECYLANHPADAPLETLAAQVKARWVCEQMHRQMKGELGLGHFEGRGWRGLHHHHAPLGQLAFAFLQHLRLGGKSAAGRAGAGPPPRPSLPAIRRRILAAFSSVLLRRPHCRQRFEHHLRL